MSPLQIMLLLRMHCMPHPNADLPPEQAFAPAMRGAVAYLKAFDLVGHWVTVDLLCDRNNKALTDYLTYKGLRLVQRYLEIEP